MWLENLKALKKKSSLTTKQIIELSGVPERSVNRIFAGETECPRVETLYQIVKVLGGSLDAILAGTQTVVGSETTETLQETVDKLSAENERLKLELKHKEEMLALHNYYIEYIKAELHKNKSE